jgi:hypothetical protein
MTKRKPNGISSEKLAPLFSFFKQKKLSLRKLSIKII